MVVAGFTPPQPGQGVFGFNSRQFGGFTPPGFAVVGESGPELIDFSQPGRVYSNADLTSALASGGSGDFVLNFNPVIQSVDEGGVRQALAEYTPGLFAQFRDSISSETARDMGRPSALRRLANG